MNVTLLEIVVIAFSNNLDDRNKINQKRKKNADETGKSKYESKWSNCNLIEYRGSFWSTEEGAGVMRSVVEYRNKLRCQQFTLSKLCQQS